MGVWIAKRREWNSRNLHTSLTVTWVVSGCIAAYALLYVIGEMAGRFFGDGYSLVPYFLRISLPAFIAIWLAFRFFLPKALESKYSDLAPGHTEYVQSIFRSEEFLSALNEVMPRGEKDEEFGLDYIPYMLQSTAARKLSHERSAGQFLLLTVFLGVSFTAAIVVLGYSLMDEAIGGTPREIRDNKLAAEGIRTDLDQLLPDYYRKEPFKSTVAVELTRLDDMKTSGSGDVDKRVAAALSNANFSGDIVALLNELNAIAADSVGEVPINSEFLEVLNSSRTKLGDFLDLQEATIPRLSRTAADIEKIAEEADDWSERSENRTAEVLKRLALGIVISSFFIAILRYSAGLYASRYREVLLADRDDFMIRRFYVAYKAARENEELLKSVLSSFVAPQAYQEITDRADADFSKAEKEILAEVVKSITKKKADG